MTTRRMKSDEQLQEPVLMQLPVLELVPVPELAQERASQQLSLAPLFSSSLMQHAGCGAGLAGAAASV